MRDQGFIQANTAQFSCTLVTKYPPRSARLSCNNKEKKSRLTSKKFREENETLGAMDWEIPIPEDLLEENIIKIVHFDAVDCDFYGSIKDLVFNWLHPFMLASKTTNTNGENTILIQEMNGPFADEYWEASGAKVETLESMKYWEVVEREVSMNVLSYTQAFKCK